MRTTRIYKGTHLVQKPLSYLFKESFRYKPIPIVMVQTSQSMFLSVLLVVSLSLLFVKGNIVDESSILAPRQDYVEGQSTWPLSGLQNNVSPGLGAGLVSLYMATLANQRAEGFCAINNDGDRESLDGCIAANVGGCIFGVYSIYRIGNGFLASRDTAPITLTGSNGLVSEMVIHSSFSRSRNLLYLILILLQEMFFWIILLMVNNIIWYIGKMIMECLLLGQS